jgi:hypothetical protein
VQGALDRHVEPLRRDELVQVFDQESQAGTRGADDHRREHARRVAQHRGVPRILSPAGGPEGRGFPRIGHGQMVEQVDEADADVIEQPIDERSAGGNPRQSPGEGRSHQRRRLRLRDPLTISVWRTGGHGHAALQRGRRPGAPGWQEDDINVTEVMKTSARHGPGSARRHAILSAIHEQRLAPSRRVHRHRAASRLMVAVATR